MLSVEDNNMLTNTDPGTPMGELFRRYWIPALLSEELLKPDCPPIRVKLLGEELLAFRDTNGKVGLIDEYCPHRLVSLYFGRNEECGIRCVYHGWKFDVEGFCVDMPSEPPKSNFKDAVKIKSYPCEERGGIVWTYMGPPEHKPPLPEMEWAMVPESHRFVTKRSQVCNYFQALEGGIDPAHVSFLHRGDIGGIGFSEGSSKSEEYLKKDTAPVFECEETDFGVLIAAKRKIDKDQSYCRITQFLMPWYNFVPPFGDAPRGGHAFVPIDNENCYNYTFTWHATRPLTEEELEREKSGAGIHAKLIPGTSLTVQNKENDYMMDRELQASGRSYTGIIGVGIEDQAVQESGKRIIDRSKERLGSSDTAIIHTRRLLLNTCRALQNGKAPKAIQPESQRIRAVSLVVKDGDSIKEVAKDLMQVTEKDFIAP